MRLLCLFFPHLPIQLAHRQLQAAARKPLATVSGEGDAATIEAISPDARAAGARPGMLAATLRARLPAMQLVPHHPGHSLSVLEHAALILRRRATPRVAIGAIDHIFVDLDGLEARFESEESAATGLTALLRAWTGLEVRGGVAGTRQRALETARLARCRPLVAEESLCSPVERLAPWQEVSLPAGVSISAPGDVPGARRRLARLLSHMQLVLDARGEGFRTAFFELDTPVEVRSLRLTWDDPSYSLADVFRRLTPLSSDEWLGQATAFRLTLGRLAPDLRANPQPALQAAAPQAVLINPVRPVQRVLLRAG